LAAAEVRSRPPHNTSTTTRSPAASPNHPPGSAPRIRLFR